MNSTVITRTVLATCQRGLSTSPVCTASKKAVQKIKVTNKVKKPKADVVLVACKSIASNHQMSVRKGRTGPDKLEFLAFDPEIQREVIYKEDHKIKSIREDFACWYTEPTELKLPQDFQQDPKKSSSPQ